MTDQIALRVAANEDLEFLFALLRASLGPYVEQTFGPWDDEDQRARFFASTDPATHRVIELDGRPVGCLAVRWLADEVRLDRIFLLPAHQSRGIGTHLVREVVAQACAAGLPVRLRVFRVNPARRLYERLGFATTGETETHVLMEHAVDRPW
ncbi:MAG: GNAT family N-acetyltransferase [Actinobacteria bacterium]|nr:GNAT family N-acetyltransferase [Actinomycetota bacterium]